MSTKIAEDNNILSDMSGQRIIELIYHPIEYEVVTFEDGQQAKVRVINSVSELAKKELNKTFKQLTRDGKL
jgi:hypothetical protein